MEIKPSKQLEELIQSAKEANEKKHTRQRNITSLNEEIRETFAKALKDLDAAVLSLADGITAEKQTAESEARKEVAKLKLQLDGSQDRKQTVFAVSSSEGNQIVSKALEQASGEAKEKWQSLEVEKMQQIEEAKKAYLLACKDYHDTLEACNDIVRNTAAQLGTDYTSSHIPNSIHMPKFTWRGSANQYYGLFEDERNMALERGEIKQYAIRPTE